MKTTIRCLAAPWIALLAASSHADATDLRVGAAAVELEADDSMPIAGGIHPGYVKGQEGKLRATAIVMEKAGAAPVAIVSCDVLMFQRDLADAALAEIENTCGIPAANVLVHATHTHHAPSTVKIHGYGRSEVFCQRLQAGIVKSAEPVIDVFRRMRKELAPQQGRQRTTWVQTIAIGDVAIVGLPAECFTKLGLDIKRRSPFKSTVVVELANDWIGYVGDREAYKLGGYQLWTGFHSYSEAGTGERIVDQAVGMLEEMARGK